MVGMGWVVGLGIGSGIFSTVGGGLIGNSWIEVFKSFCGRHLKQCIKEFIGATINTVVGLIFLYIPIYVWRSSTHSIITPITAYSISLLCLFIWILDKCGCVSCNWLRIKVSHAREGCIMNSKSVTPMKEKYNLDDDNINNGNNNTASNIVEIEVNGNRNDFVWNWLHAINLTQYYDKFIDNEFKNEFDINAIVEMDCYAMGITNSKHIEKILMKNGNLQLNINNRLNPHKTISTNGAPNDYNGNDNQDGEIEQAQIQVEGLPRNLLPAYGDTFQ